MPFFYATQPHTRTHGPVGYQDYANYKDWLRDEFSFRCVYCLARERWYPNGQDSFCVEHAKPKGVHKDLKCDYDNLLYACNRCNCDKGQHIVLDPCEVAFGDHLRVRDDGTIEALSREGQDLIDLLGLAEPSAVHLRHCKLQILSLYQRSPADPEVRTLYEDAFGYPDDLPNLDQKEPPEGNAREEGLKATHRSRKMKGLLPPVYGLAP
jgi:hypothetical protein